MVLVFHVYFDHRISGTVWRWWFVTFFNFHMRNHSSIPAFLLNSFLRLPLFHNLSSSPTHTHARAHTQTHTYTHKHALTHIHHHYYHYILVSSFYFCSSYLFKIFLSTFNSQMPWFEIFLYNIFNEILSIFFSLLVLKIPLPLPWVWQVVLFWFVRLIVLFFFWRSLSFRYRY